MKTKLILFLFILVTTLTSYSQANYKNPFSSSLPEEETEQVVDSFYVEDEAIRLPDEITVEGILWGNDNPQVIINEEIYSKGDKIKGGREIFIFSINNNTVLLSYKGKIFKKKPAKN
jgi:type II secretory pathway component PulC